ncbi:MAG TPA: efflux RND transporter periplasmic adaptor subunit [Gammaproteobacteria bacterium]|nr:efflux RND transporter periplasmic adaptor subunit [Gammaproteobacteria bacterium]
MSNKLFLAVLATATLAALTGCSSKANKDPEGTSATASNVTLTAAQQKHIRLYTAAPAKFRKTIETTGTVDYDHDHATTVLAPFSGPVVRVLVSLGDKVTQGQPLALVNSPDFAAAIGAYRKALASARAARHLADLDRDLLKHQGISQREEAQAQADAIGAEADADAARQALVALHVDPKTIKAIQAGKPVPNVEGIIRAPIAGTVVEKSIAPGQLLQAGATSCFVVADLSHVWVDAQVFGADIAAVAPGDPADVETGLGSKKMQGSVTNVSAQVDPDTGAAIARVVVKNPGDRLKKDMYVRVLIHSPRPIDGLLVPVSAVLRDDENLPFVYVVQSDGGFARRRITLGYRDGNRFAITAGLKAGDRIVADGGIFLRFIESQ